MANYTIDDIEILRRKSGITYEEAVNLLEYHNGSLTRSLIDLERNGRIKDEPVTRGAGQEQSGLKRVLTTLYRMRMVVKNDDVVVANLSVLFMILTVMFAPHVAVCGLIVSLILRYTITVDRNNQVFAQDTFDSMMQTAKINMQNTMQNFSRSFAGEETSHTEPERPHSAAAATGTQPVQVQFSNGSHMNVRADDDGYHEADIG